jgi:hypothetical protein
VSNVPGRRSVPRLQAPHGRNSHTQFRGIPSGRCKIGTTGGFSFRQMTGSQFAGTALTVCWRCIVRCTTQARRPFESRAYVYAATKAEKFLGGAAAAWRREVVMRAASLHTSGMRAAAFQFLGNFSELGRKFEQRLPRVDLCRLFRELQAFFGMLSAFFRRRHDGDPVCATSTLPVSFRSHRCRRTGSWLIPSSITPALAGARRGGPQHRGTNVRS